MLWCMRLQKFLFTACLAVVSLTVCNCAAPTAPSASSSPVASNATNGSSASQLFAQSTLPEARAQAATEHKLLLVDSTASWCPPCKQMEKTTWTDPAVQGRVRPKFIAIQVDVDQQRSVAEELKIEAMPTLIVFSSDGKELARSVGYKDPKTLLSWLDEVESKAPTAPSKQGSAPVSKP